VEDSVITIDEITIVIDGREIIYDYSEQIPAGSITVIVGPNGCGKSTLLAAIAGDIAPDKGTITIDEHHPILTSAGTLAGIRSMVVQNQSFTLGFTVRQVIEMAGASVDVMKALELTDIADRLVTTLSGGEAQRVAIAQAIAQNYARAFAG
jgi:iron complex transport system ATP-binding protein